MHWMHFPGHMAFLTLFLQQPFPTALLSAGGGLGASSQAAHGAAGKHATVPCFGKAFSFGLCGSSSNAPYGWHSFLHLVGHFGAVHS